MYKDSFYSLLQNIINMEKGKLSKAIAAETTARYIEVNTYSRTP